VPFPQYAYTILFLLYYTLSQAQPWQRAANTSLVLPQTLPVYGYALSNAFPGLSVSAPMAVATPPGETNRLFILERSGRVIAVTNLAAPTRTVFLDISTRVTAVGCEEGLLGIAFHPNYATNGYFYLFYSLLTTTTGGSGVHQRVARFQVSSTNANLAKATSELPLITQYDQECNHNGGCLQFGPDGYLYVSLGDEGHQYDFYDNSQRIDKDFFSGMLRLDVDKRSTNLPPHSHAALMGQVNYFVPADNPYVNATTFNGFSISSASVRTEFYAVGLRNPWRFSFDSVTGVCYCGDVGQDTYEEVNVIVKGGNYGWVWREGVSSGPVAGNQGLPGFSYRRPIAVYSHGSSTNQGHAVIGGVVYRGNRFSQLVGKYIFADYTSGNVWALTPNGTNTVPFQRLMGVGSGFTGFGTDPQNGDVLMLSMAGNSISRLIYNTNAPSTNALPATLADTGAFRDTSALTPSPGVLPYDLNVPFWSDNAKKTRWVSVPNTNLTITFNRDGNWSFPTGTVWIKHFELELINGVASSAKRLETRLLIKNSNGLYGVTYRWGDSLTNATLVPEEGLDEALVINDGGNVRTQVWHYPGRGECLICHTPVAGFALGFNTAQLNRDSLRALAHPTNSSVSLEYRVRSYLAANCTQCHQPGGAALGNWDARISNPLSAAGLVNGSLVNNLGNTENHVVTANDTAHSALFLRISTNGSVRMPPLASNLLDTNAMNLVSAWITNGLSKYQTFPQWQLAHFGSTNSPQTGGLEDLDGDGSINFEEYLLGTNPHVADAWRISIQAGSDSAQIGFPQIANRGFQIEFATNLQAPIFWRPLDISGNRPLISASNFSAAIFDGMTNTPKFYRVRVYEP
jgi:glucose/arabinose dehydrogenase